MMSRVSSGQAERGMRSVSSVTHAPSRMEPSVSRGGDPVLLLDQEQCITNSLVDGESDGEVAVGRHDGVDEAMGGSGRVGPHQGGVGDQSRVVALEVAGLVLLGQPGQGPVEQFDVVVRVVGPGVTRPQHGGQRFSCRSRTTPQREEPEAMLVGGGGVLLLGVGVRSVASKSMINESPGRRCSPHHSPGSGYCVGDGPELEGRRRLDGPPGRRDRSHRTEQLACSRREAMSARQSAPSAMATARWVRTTPGSWVCQLIPQAAMATDIASVRPLRSASSDNRAVPAWDTRFFPPVVTLIDRVARLFFTFKEPSSWFGLLP